jgi:DNA-binding GntR family transcriptional regulator
MKKGELMAVLPGRKVEQTPSLRDQISRSLSASIISGELAPGTLVSVPALAAEFEVSATPVREAMLDLEQRGFVTPVRNKGFRVTAVSSRDLHDIAELRQLLEVPAMGKIVEGFPLHTLRDWRQLATTISEHARAADLTAFIETDREFHLGLLALGGNQRLVDMVRELRLQTRMVNMANMTHTEELAEAALEHHRMLDLIEAGDRAALEALTVRHVGHIRGWWAGQAEAS